MENLIKDITEKVQNYIDEQYDYDDVLVVEKVDGEYKVSVVAEDAEVDDAAEVYCFPDLICFDENGVQVPDVEAIGEIGE
jgi:hypothetical protein